MSVVIVCGCFRGGTSAVAGCVNLLGIPFPNTDPINLETPFSEQLVEGNVEPFIEWLLFQQKRFSRFGFKFPAFPKCYESLKNILDDPKFIIVFRDPLLVARSEIKYNPGSSYEAKGVVNLLNDWVIPQLQDLARLARMTEGRHLLISFENLLRDPVSIVSELGSFLNLHLDSVRVSACLEWVKTKEYKDINVIRKKYGIENLTL